MLRITHHRYGEPADVLQVEHAADPASPTCEQVLIRVRMRPVNLGSLLGVRGRYRPANERGEASPHPASIGIEGVGVVEAVGAGVDVSSGVAPGVRVAFFPVPGTWNELILISASFVTPVPEDLSDAVAAQLHLNPLTAVMLMRAAEAAGAGPGEDSAIVLDAAGSSVAGLVAAIARRKDIPTVGLVRRREAASRASELTSTITTEGADWREQLRAASKGNGFRVALTTVGGETGTALFESLAPGGSLISYGDLSNEPLRLNALTIAARNLHISGVLYAGWRDLTKDQRAADVAVSIALARARPELFPVAAEYDLTRVVDAARHAERSGKQGLVMLTSGSSRRTSEGQS